MSVREGAAALLLLLGIAVTSLSVLGTLREQGLYLRLQSAGAALVLGVVAVLAASIGTSDPAIAARAALAAVFVVLTSTVSSHAIALVHHRAGGEDRSGEGRAED